MAAQGQWFRFSSYETVSSSGGFSQHVRPARGAALSYYRPFDHYPEILRDYLELARDLSVDQPFVPGKTDEESKARIRARVSRNARRVIGFAERYGLPGTLWQCDPQIDHGSIFVFDDQGRQKFFDDYRRIFVQSSIWSLSLPTGPYKTATDLIDAKEFLGYFLADRLSISDALNFNKRFLRAYAEPVTSIERDSADALRIAEDWERYKKDGHQPEDSFVDRAGQVRAPATWRQELTGGFGIGTRVGLAINLDAKRVRVDYRFSSLISALRIMFTLNAVSEGQQVRLCALSECGEPFIARNDRARYCRESHSNTDRQRRFVKKKSGGIDGRKRKTKKKS